MALSSSSGVLADTSTPGMAHTDTAPAQFVTLPFHPRPHDDSTEGLIEFENHFIWRAPLANGLPPGMTRGDVRQPGTEAPLAARSGSGSGSTLGLIDASSDASSYQGETAADFNGTVLLGGSNSIFPGACSSNPCYVRAYATTGSVFSSETLSGTWNGTTFGISFDPGIDHDTSGNFYYVMGAAPLSGSYPNSIAVAKAGPSGTTFGTPVAVTFNKRKFFDDKYYIAVDRSPSIFQDRIYVGWDRNVSNNQILYVAYSSDHGANWSAPIKVNDGTSGFERVIGAYPAVNHTNGTVHMSWHDYAKDIIFVDKSTTGGASWGADVAAATTHTGFGVDIGCNGGRKQSPAHSLKVGPSGVLHLVYADSIQNRGFDILYTRSTDSGATWSAPVVLNDDFGGAHQYHPTLAVSGGTNGDTVAVSFYDRRDDANNCLTHVYATRSTNGGAAWSANVIQTSTPSNFNGNANGPGDYSSATPTTAGAASAFHSQKPIPSTDYDVYSISY